MRAVETFGIDAPASTVWAVLADVSRWPEWTPTMTSVTVEGGGSLSPGMSARVKQPRLPPAKWVVTTFEEGREFTWETRSPGVVTSGGHRITESSGESTTVELTLEMTGPLAGVAGLLLGAMSRRNVAAEAEALKRRSESGRAQTSG